jgi:CDP-diacylglycerol---glycerol-3-phosphate 3-phosphatidyltransferase
MTTKKTKFGPSALNTPANFMTGFRIIITPLFVYLVVVHRTSWWTVVTGFLAVASDYFDGIVARRHGTTNFGTFLDPLADKIMVLGSLYALLIARPTPVRSFVIPAILITVREVWMSVYRSRAARRGVSIPATKLAKWKTFVQDWAIAFTVLPFTAKFPIIAEITIWLAVAMTLVTGWQYYRDGREVLARAR